MNLLLDVILKPSMVLLLALVAMPLLRGRSAALRHAILAAALLCAAIVPLVGAVAPEWHLPGLRILTEAPAPPTASSAVITETVTVSGAPDPVPSTASRDRRSIARGRGLPRGGSLLVWAWILGSIPGLALLIAGVRRLVRLAATSRRIEHGAWARSAAAIGREYGFRNDVTLLEAPGSNMLVTWGFFRPKVLLPTAAHDWPADRVSIVLAHELAHIQRGDWAVLLVTEALRAVYWFNPLFWLACATLRRESEHAADDLVLDTGITGTSYASDLVALARTLRVHGRTWLPAPSIARPSTLERRVRAMLNPQLNRRPVSRAWQFVLMALLCAIALPIAAASQAASAPSGMVVDPMDRPLADAVVRLSAIANNEQAYETRTDANGAFKFNAVTPGDYMLSIRYPGFSSSRQRVQLRAGEFTFTLKAQVGTLQETISVRAGATGSTATSRSEQSAPVPEAPSCSATGAGELTPPMKIRDVRPRYKQAWVDAGIEGTILMQARIGRDGYVRSVNALSPTNPELEDEAVAAVSQWRFSPTYLNCSPIEVEMYVTVSFKLER